MKGYGEMEQLTGLNIENIGKHIYEIMKSKHISILEVSQYLGVSYQEVYKWTRGKCLPEIENFYNLSLYLGVTIDEILSGKGLVKSQMFFCQTNHLLAYYKEIQKTA